jgi:hypothetical protein
MQEEIPCARWQLDGVKKDRVRFGSLSDNEANWIYRIMPQAMVDIQCNSKTRLDGEENLCAYPLLPVIVEQSPTVAAIARQWMCRYTTTLQIETMLRDLRFFFTDVTQEQFRERKEKDKVACGDRIAKQYKEDHIAWRNATIAAIRGTGIFVPNQIQAEEILVTATIKHIHLLERMVMRLAWLASGYPIDPATGLCEPPNMGRFLTRFPPVKAGVDVLIPGFQAAATNDAAMFFTLKQRLLWSFAEEHKMARESLTFFPPLEALKLRFGAFLYDEETLREYLVCLRNTSVEF